MAITGDGHLHVYAVSVGQGDTTVVVSPVGRLIVIDAMRGGKLVQLLKDLGLAADGQIEHLIVTHPHDDHFNGSNTLVKAFRVREATVAPFWHEFGMGPPTYRALIGRLADRGADVTFLSGYSRWYPDGVMTGGANPEIDPNAPFLEMLGPTNGLVRVLEGADVFNANHLSIMTRLAWRSFRMVSAGDAQMENWGGFDHERMLEGKCQVLRAAHHGSQNGTQWERVDRLAPSQIIVSSDPASGHHLPDLSSTAIFAKFDSVNGQMAVITRDTGTIHIRVDEAGTRTLERFGDAPTANVDLGAATPLTEATNPTDWPALLALRVSEL
jgi:beta-lactamase superfamily II metal-dependent hydrolase